MLRLTVVGAVLTACLSSGAWADGIAVEKAWARAPAGNGVSALYFTLRNTGAADSLTGVETSAGGMAMLHESKIVNGISQMDMLDAIPIPAHETVALKPGGFHVMLMDMTHAPKAGETLTVTLSFAHAPKVVASAVVVKPGGSAP